MVVEFVEDAMVELKRLEPGLESDFGGDCEGVELKYREVRKEKVLCSGFWRLGEMMKEDEDDGNT